MPHIPFPDTRTLREKRTEKIDGRECDVYVYDEEYTTKWYDPMDWLVRLAHGKSWDARHIRVEIEHTHDDYIKRIHDTRGRHWPTDLPTVEEQVSAALDDAREYIESGAAEDVTCHL